MRVDSIKGLYLQYKDAACPVEVLDRVSYAFSAKNDRTCLIVDPNHVAYLLETRRYRVKGVELEEVKVAEAPAKVKVKPGPKPKVKL